MLKKIKNCKAQEISQLASQSEDLERQVHNSIVEILKLINNVNIATDVNTINNLVHITKKPIGFYIENLNDEQGKKSQD